MTGRSGFFRPSLAHHLRALLQPSLTRRLVLAQMLMVALLWFALATYARWETEADSAEDDLSKMRKGAALVIPLTQALWNQPEVLRQALQKVDDFQRANVVPIQAQGVMVAPRIYLWHDGQLVYRSADARADWVAPPSGALVDIVVDGQPWRTYGEASADGRTRFAALAPASPEAWGLTPFSGGWLLLPLMVSLPLLVIPAWLSVRFALRPWSRLSGEIASRGPHDLTPLQFSPGHRELNPLSHAIDQWLARLRQSQARERHFIADAAHELRTPIAAMQINAEALRERRLVPADLELLDGLLQSNRRAGRLVSQLLALTRSDASPALRQQGPMDLHDLVQDVLAQAATLAKAGGVELDLASQPACMVLGDAESLRLLLDNVIGNAVKFSPAGGTVHVALVRLQDAVQLEVRDQGPGIDAALRERVFDRFYRAPGQTQEGSGLGLAIAKAVADQHQATLTLHEGPDGLGLLVRVRWPALRVTA